MEKLDRIPEYDYVYSRFEFTNNLREEVLESGDEAKILELFTETNINNKLFLIKHMAAKNDIHYFTKLISLVENFDLSFEDNVLLKITATNCADKILDYLLQNNISAKVCYNIAIKIASQYHEELTNELYCPTEEDAEKLDRQNVIVLRMLLENGADATIDDNYPICAAALSGMLNNIKMLIQFDADVCARNDYPLRIAARYGFFRIVEYLIKNGANINADNDYVLRQFVGSSSPDSEKNIKFLLDAGANGKSLTKDDLIKTIKYGTIGTIELLIKHNVNFSIVNDQPATDQNKIIAAKIKLLLDAGVDAEKLLLSMSS